eukprot:SAG31_NODE_6_length_43291_cov_191.503496_6_plen_943_part_00
MRHAGGPAGAGDRGVGICCTSRAGLAQLIILFLMVVTFGGFTKWTEVQCATKVAAASKAAPAPAELRIGVLNINGAKTRADKRRRLATLHDDFDIMTMCEIANKAAAPTVDELASIVTDIAPYGRGWATAHTAITLGPQMCGVEVEVATALAGRVIRMDFEWSGNATTVMAAYAPADPSKRPRFLRALAECIPPDREIWLGGDFNCVVDVQRDSKHDGTYHNTGGVELRAICDEFGLADLAAACSAPETGQWFTFTGNMNEGRNYERRLDYVFTTTGLLDKIEVAAFKTHATGIKGVDHHLVGGTLLAAARPEADPAKVFPSMQLDVVFAGDFVEHVNDLLTNAAAGELPDNASDWCAFVDDITREIQQMYLCHRSEVHAARSPEVRAARRQLEQFCAAHVGDASASYFDGKHERAREHVRVCEAAAEVTHCSEEIGQRAWKECMLASHRDRVQPRAASGQFKSQCVFVPPTRPEQSLEHVIGSLGDDRGWTEGDRPLRPAIDPQPDGSYRKLTSEADIINNTEIFWSALYKRYRSHVGCQRHVLERLAACARRVPASELDRLAAPFTEAEVVRAIRSLKKGKVAGTSGLPAELYQATAEAWAPILQRQMNACVTAGRGLSDLQRRGRISQLYKAGSREEVANHRPVCALNKDYQVCSAMLYARWAAISSILTGHDQTGFVPGRFMDWNIMKYMDGLHFAREHNIPLAGILYDFKKAYDNVSHAFLWAVVDILCGVPLDDVWTDLQGAQAAPPGEYTYQFSAAPTRLLQTLYSKHVRCVTVNGTTTDWFLLESSVPQGDILAPTAFILYIEALGILLRTDPDIEGLRLPSGAQLIVTRFADDTGILVSPASIHAAMCVVEVFSAASGMVNHNIKTVGMWCGSLWRREEAWAQAAYEGETPAAGGPTRLTWLRAASVMKLLGVMMGYDVDPNAEWRKLRRRCS